MQLAAVMLLGGCIGRGFVRSWCVGCLAICIWYEDLLALPESPRAGAARHRWVGLELGASPPLHVRHERVNIGLRLPFRILYASDLHLGHRWTRNMPKQLVKAAQKQRDIILLGGDLLDHATAHQELQNCVTQLASIAQVYAVAGNHDQRIDMDVRERVCEKGGGHWLNGPVLQAGYRLEGMDASSDWTKPNPSPPPVRILCATIPASTRRPSRQAMTWCLPAICMEASASSPNARAGYIQPSGSENGMDCDSVSKTPSCWSAVGRQTRCQSASTVRAK